MFNPQKSYVGVLMRNTELFSGIKHEKALQAYLVATLSSHWGTWWYDHGNQAGSVRDWTKFSCQFLWCDSIGVGQMRVHAWFKVLEFLSEDWSCGASWPGSFQGSGNHSDWAHTTERISCAVGVARINCGVVGRWNVAFIRHLWSVILRIEFVWMWRRWIIHRHWHRHRNIFLIVYDGHFIYKCRFSLHSCAHIWTATAAALVADVLYGLFRTADLNPWAIAGHLLHGLVLCFLWKWTRFLHKLLLLRTNWLFRNLVNFVFQGRLFERFLPGWPADEQDFLRCWVRDLQQLGGLDQRDLAGVHQPEQSLLLSFEIWSCRRCGDWFCHCEI